MAGVHAQQFARLEFLDQDLAVEVDEGSTGAGQPLHDEAFAAEQAGAEPLAFSTRDEGERALKTFRQSPGPRSIKIRLLHLAHPEGRQKSCNTCDNCPKRQYKKNHSLRHQRIENYDHAENDGEYPHHKTAQ